MDLRHPEGWLPHGAIEGVTANSNPYRYEGLRKGRILLHLILQVNRVQQFLPLDIPFFLCFIFSQSVPYIREKINCASHWTAQPSQDTSEINDFAFGGLIRWRHELFEFIRVPPIYSKGRCLRHN